MSISDPSSQPTKQQTKHLSKHDDDATTLISRSNTHTAKIPTMSQRSSNSSSKSKDNNAEEIARINAACARIQTANPEQPYTLSCPVNVEPRYHYPSAQEAASWRKGTPFYPHEEGLQYMTYVYREPGDSCFVIRSHLDDEREEKERQERRLKDSQSQHQRNGSGSALSTAPGTPLPGSQGAGKEKKKISLSAYKNKKLGIEGSPEKEPVAEKKSMENKKEVNGAPKEAEKDDILDTMEELMPAGSKRPRDSDLEKSISAEKHASSAKKPRLSPPPTLKPSRQTSPKPSLQPSPLPDQANGARHGLPVLLSPTNPFESGAPKKASTPTPEKKKSSTKWDLPEMLSPTLPPKIEAELAREKERGRPDSAASSPASKATRTPGSVARSPAEKSRERLEESPLAKVKDGTKKLADIVESDDNEEPEPPKPKRLIVRLKYSKKLAYRIRSLLKIPPHPDRKRFPYDEDFLLARSPKALSKSVAELSGGARSRPRSISDLTASPLSKPKKDASKDDSKKDRLHPDTAKSTPRVAEKRPRVEEPEPAPSTKKQKVPSSLDLEKEKNPRTPITSAIPSPALQKSGGSIKDTPRQGHLSKAVAMVRSNSADSPVATPKGKNDSQSTPKPASKGPTSAPSNGAITGPRAAEVKALQEQSQKYNALGRKLKHENQDINSRATKTEPERKRMALLGIECIMSYMLAYSLGDSRRKIEGRSAEIESSWRTLLPLFKHMGRFVAPYKPLDGLHNYLGITINARISNVSGDRVMRLQNAPVAADSPQSSIAAASDPAAENIRVHFEALTALTECTRAATSALPIEDVMSTFPAAWASRSTKPRGPTSESLVDEKKGEVSLSGEYWLPVGLDSAPVQAVRFAVEVVKEWIRIEELGYEPRIRI